MSNLTNNTTSLQAILDAVNALPEAESTIPIQSYCQVIAQREGTSGAYGSDAEYAGYNSSDWYPYALKFTTPEFTGKSASLQFNILMSWGYRNGSKSATASLRWALCSSDANFSSYDDTKNDVVDTYQLEKGIAEFTGLTSSGTTVTLTVPTTALAGNTTYYLIFWGDGSSGYSQDFVTIQAPSNHSISLTYEVTASGSGSGGASVGTCTVTVTFEEYFTSAMSAAYVNTTGLCADTVETNSVTFTCNRGSIANICLFDSRFDSIDGDIVFEDDVSLVQYFGMDTIILYIPNDAPDTASVTCTIT